MSRPITLNETVQLHPSSLDTTNSIYASIDSSYPIANAYDDSDSTTYARINLATGSRATTYFYLNFDTSEIPDGSTIVSVECSAKASVNTTNSKYISTRQMQMCTETTTKGSATTLSNSSYSPTSLTVGTWTLAELRNAKIRCYVIRGTSSTSSTSYYLRFYGATLTIQYSYNGTMYEITTNSTTDKATIIPESEEKMDGEEYIARIDTADVSKIMVTDNGVNVTSQLIQIEASSGDTLTAVPASVRTEGSISGSRYNNAIGQGSDASSTSGNDYSNDYSSYIYYSFGEFEIPPGTTSINVSCDVKGHCESTSNSSEVAECTLYSGSTALSSAVSFDSTYDSIITLTANNVTEEQLADLVLRFEIGYYGGLISGATLKVTYTLPSTDNPYYYEYIITNMSADHVIIVADKTSIFIKKNGSWQNYTKAYRKVNGQWQQIDDLTTVFSSSENYVYGGDI